MTEYSPHQHFLDFHKEVREELSKHISSRWLRLSLDAALAVTAFQGVSELEMAGVRRFLANFSILAEQDKPVASYPSPRLESFELPEETVLREHLKKIEPL